MRGSPRPSSLPRSRSLDRSDLRQHRCRRPAAHPGNRNRLKQSPHRPAWPDPPHPEPHPGSQPSRRESGRAHPPPTQAQPHAAQRDLLGHPPTSRLDHGSGTAPRLLHPRRRNASRIAPRPNKASSGWAITASTDVHSGGTPALRPLRCLTYLFMVESQIRRRHVCVKPEPTQRKEVIAVGRPSLFGASLAAEAACLWCWTLDTATP
jgi:hypothetical protein